MFDGITENELKKRIDQRQIYPFSVISVSAFVEPLTRKWQVKIKICEDGIDKEGFIEVKRGEVKSYSNLQTLANRLASCGVMELILDLSGIGVNLNEPIGMESCIKGYE
jgi:hypothetical protein